MSAAWHWHGGALDAAKAHFGTGGQPWLDLSTGINPSPWPDADLMPIDWQRLPERSALEALEEAAADYFGLAPRHVCAVPGTEIGMRLIGGMIGGPARHVAPGYRTHGEMIAGSVPVGWSEAMDTSGTLILANPNNPDGRRVHCDDLGKLLARRDGDRWLLMDEAFADADPAGSMADAVRDERPLVIFRSFGKFFGLAGVRLGFVLGPEKLLTSLRQLLGAWPLSAAAVAIGTAAYRDRRWIADTRTQLRRAAAALDILLTRHGYRPMGECALFRLIETPDAAALFERLACQAILTRPFSGQPRWLRIGLPPHAAALDRLHAALGHA